MTDSTGRRIIAHGILTGAVALTFLPLFWMLTMSLKSPEMIFDGPLNPFPGPPDFGNYLRVLESTDVVRQLFNSVVFAGGVTLGQLAISVPAAYAFSQWHFRGSGVLFAAFLLTMTVPFMVFYVPNYVMLARLDLLNTHIGMILPQIASAYGIFLLRQHFRSFPKSILDAARVDGANEFTLIWRIVLPASRGAVFALGVFIFVTTWNEYVWPLLVARDPSMYILTVGVTQFASEEGGTRWGEIMAAATLASLPTLVVYAFVRKHILATIMEGAVKG